MRKIEKEEIEERERETELSVTNAEIEKIAIHSYMNIADLLCAEFLAVCGGKTHSAENSAVVQMICFFRVVLLHGTRSCRSRTYIFTHNRIFCNISYTWHGK